MSSSPPTRLGRSTWLLLLVTCLAGCPDQPGTTASQAADKTSTKTSSSKTTPPEAKTAKTGTAPVKSRTRTVSLTRKGTRSVPLIRRPLRLPVKKRPDTPKPEPTSGSSIDLAKVVRAPARLRLSEAAKIGWKARQETRGPGYRGVTWTAIVGEEEQKWRVEHVPYGLQAYEGLSPEASKMILGLVVSKVDGTVIKAVIGKPGEAGTPIRVFELPSRENGKDGRTPKRVELELAGKAVPADLREETLEGFGTVRTWTGVGPLAGVLLKSIDPKKTKELQGAPSVETLTVGEVALKVHRCTYADGDVTVVTDHPVVRGLFGGIVSMKSGETTLAVTSVETQAKAQLDWDSD